MTIEVLGIDHIFITVSNLERSVDFYDKLMQLLGFKKGTGTIGNHPHIHYFNRLLQYTLRPAKPNTIKHDPFVPGLHHICFQVVDKKTVDEIARGLQELNITASAPRIYPEYDADYYAIFLNDPDGIELEIVNRHQVRITIADNWEQLKHFENPLSKAGLI